MTTTPNPLLNKFANAPQWVLWKKVIRNGKPTKVPFQPNGKEAESTNEDTWSTYDEVIKKVANYDGVGIVFPQSAEILGIDFDQPKDSKGVPVGDFFDEQGQINNPVFRKIYEAADTYTEKSPSGQGLHLIFLVSPYLHLDASRSKKMPNFECYTQGRYFTYTGDIYGETKQVRVITPEQAELLLAMAGYPWGRGTQEVETEQKTFPESDDNSVLERMFASKHGDEIVLLYDGKSTEYNGDHSSEDMALCNHLAYWCNNNAEQIERIWKASPLGQREKTQKRPDYRTRTVEAAVRFNKNIIPPVLGGIGVAPSTDGVISIPATDIAVRPVQWVWRGFLAKGKITLLAGAPGLGKSQVCLSIAATISSGGLFPASEEQAKIGSVAIISAEDDPADTIIPRLVYAGADLNKIQFVTGVRITDERNKKQRVHGIDLSLHADTIISFLEKTEDLSLLIVDPVSAFLGNADSHNNAEMRQVLSQLSESSQRKGVAILLNTHVNKNGQGDAVARVMGSQAFVAAARAAFLVTKDKDNSTRRILSPIKNNISQDMSGLAYSIEAGTVIYQDQMLLDIARIRWESDVVHITADEALLKEKKAKDEDEEKLDVRDWLEELLISNPRGMLLTEILSLAKKSGISERTLKRARIDLQVESVPSGIGASRIWKYANTDPL